jgi:hypothetical protein
MDLIALGLDTCPKCLGLGGAVRLKGLGLRPCHSQTTWVRRNFSAPSFFGIEGHVRSKLIKITIIIIIIIIIIIDFNLQIKFMFFSILIKFISNLIIFMILIIILNLSDLSFYNF